MATFTSKMANGWKVVITDSDDARYKRKADAFKNDELMFTMYAGDDDAIFISKMATAISKNYGDYVYEAPVQFAKWFN